MRAGGIFVSFETGMLGAILTEWRDAQPRERLHLYATGLRPVLSLG
jgi:hypothetical protein